MLPPSPAKNPDDYYRFVRAVVARAKGRVRYWQNDSEPNSPIYWAGTKEFVAQLKIFHKAVKDADPSAVVVVGGYDGLFNPPGTHAIPSQEKGLEFFDYVMKETADVFDVFDLRPYADPTLSRGAWITSAAACKRSATRSPSSLRNTAVPVFMSFPPT